MKRAMLIGAVVAALLLGGAAYAATSQWGEYKGLPIVRVLVNGRQVQGDVPAVIMDGRTMVPLRFVSQATGAGVGWDQETQTASVHAARTIAIMKKDDEKTLLCSAIGVAFKATDSTNSMSDFQEFSDKMAPIRVGLRTLPLDAPYHDLAAEGAHVLDLYMEIDKVMAKANDLKATNPRKAMKMLHAARYMLAVATDRANRFVDDYAAGPGKGKGPCGGTVSEQADPWSGIQ